MGHDRNKYLLDHYGITEARYEEMKLEQGGCCKCCGQIPTGKPLHVDHDHKIASLKIKVWQSGGCWWAAIAEFSETFSAITVELVRKAAKRWLLAKSVRGLLCWKCNEGLRSFKNRSDVMRSAAKYLDDFAIKVLS